MSPLENAFSLFDAYNRKDPNLVAWEGIEYPSEYFYALQLNNWVMKLNPGASEAVLLASRAQHIGRWEIPRSLYDDGKIGYLKWRKDLAKFHAEKAGELLLAAGYAEATIVRVQAIILKINLRHDTEVQLMENALCLVFLEFQYGDFLRKHADEKMIGILQKTWAKMTQPGKEEALKLNFGARGKMLLDQALNG